MPASHWLYSLLAYLLLNWRDVLKNGCRGSSTVDESACVGITNLPILLALGAIYLVIAKRFDVRRGDS